MYSPKETLHNLVIEQHEELQNGQFPHCYSHNRKSLLEAYLGSERFEQAYNATRNYLLMPRTDKELEEIRKRFAGRLYEDLAYIFMANEEFQSGVILSPERAFEFYRAMYPNKDIIEHPFGSNSLKGISVPDGIAVRENEGIDSIVGVCEYTLSGHRGIFQDKYEWFNARKRNFPGLFSNAQLLFVVPNKTSLLGAAKGRNQVRFNKMPFTHEQFRNFIDKVYCYLAPEDMDATLAEIQEEARRQYYKEIDALWNGNIRPERLLYLLQTDGPGFTASINSKTTAKDR